MWKCKFKAYEWLMVSFIKQSDESSHNIKIHKKYIAFKEHCFILYILYFGFCLTNSKPKIIFQSILM